MADGTNSEDEIGGILFISGYTYKDVALPTPSDRSRRTAARASAPAPQVAPPAAPTAAPASLARRTKVSEDQRSRPRPVRVVEDGPPEAPTNSKSRKRTPAPTTGFNSSHSYVRRLHSYHTLDQLPSHTRGALALSTIVTPQAAPHRPISRSYLHARIAWQIYYDITAAKQLASKQNAPVVPVRTTSSQISPAFLTPLVQTAGAKPRVSTTPARQKAMPTPAPAPGPGPVSASMASMSSAPHTTTSPLVSIPSHLSLAPSAHHLAAASHLIAGLPAPQMSVSPHLLAASSAAHPGVSYVTLPSHLAGMPQMSLPSHPGAVSHLPISYITAANVAPPYPTASAAATAAAASGAPAGPATSTVVFVPSNGSVPMSSPAVLA
eukprot:m.109692 g.109692  ORF g.109692 m.109692 type:complete len:379 (-) comp14317_c0_seq3:43-1179(-)